MTPGEPHETLAEAFRWVARKFPENVAVNDGANRCTYQQLDDWTDQIASEIDGLAGPGPGVVAMLARFDIYGIAGLIAATKTRHSMLAIDPDVPHSVIADLVRSQLPLVGLAAPSLGDLSAAIQVETGLVPLVLERVEGLPQRSELPESGRADDLSALRRTSGSTGASKLVAVTNASELSRARNGAQQNLLRPGARYAVASSLEVGMGRGATLRALLAGATLLPLDLRAELPTDAVARLIAEGVTHFHGTPTGFRLLSTGLRPGSRIDSLEFIHLGGERTTSRDLKMVRDVTPADCLLKIIYSSSETGVVAQAAYRTGDIDPAARIELTIASAATVEIFGSDGEVLPCGQTGRVSVSGASVSSGYTNSRDPKLKARHENLANGQTRFLTDDLGHLSESGKLVLEGRTGHEIKVRGQRVDLQQLEDWLLQQEGVHEAVAFPIEGKAGSRIVAAVSGQPGDLRSAMEKNLPRSMHPAELLVLENLPRNSSMKIDKRFLAREAVRKSSVDRSLDGFDDRAQLVAAAWQEVLGRLPSSPDERFDTLGGDSVQAMALVMRLEEVTGQRLPADFVWQYRTINEQVLALTKQAVVQLDSDPLIYEFGTSEPPSGRRIFAIANTHGHVGIFRHLAAALESDWNVTGLLNPAFHDPESAPTTIDDLADRFLKAILSCQSNGPYILAGYSFGGIVAHEIGRRLSMRKQEVRLVLIDSRPRELMQRHWRLAKGVLEQVRMSRRLLGNAALKYLLAYGRQSPDRQGPIQTGRDFRKFRLQFSPLPTVLIKAGRLVETSPDYGWSKVTLMKGVIEIPGRHSELLNEANAHVVADAISKVFLHVFED